MAKIDALFKLMNEQGASDLHLISGSQPIFRIHGDMERVDHKSLENEELKDMLYEIVPEHGRRRHGFRTTHIHYPYHCHG